MRHGWSIYAVQPLLFRLNRLTREVAELRLRGSTTSFDFTVHVSTRQVVELRLHGSDTSFQLEPAPKRSGWTTRLSYFSLFIKSGPRFPGWCATDTDADGKMREVGLCADSCMSQATNIDFTAVNLLTQDECMYIFNLSKFLVSLNKSATEVFQREGGGM